MPKTVNTNYKQSKLHIHAVSCSMYGGNERCIHDFGGENLRKGDHLEDQGVILNDIKMDLEKWDGAMDWIYLVQDRNRWRALVTTAMNFRVS